MNTLMKRYERHEARILKHSPWARNLYFGVESLRQRRDLAVRRDEAARLARHLGVRIDPDQGFAVVPPGTWPEVDEVVRYVRQVTHAADEAFAQSSKSHMVTDLLPPEELHLGSPFLRLALRPDVLAAVSTYLGMVPLLNNAMIWCSRYDGAALKTSQLFHIDAEDRTQVKLFVYCQDVSPDEGPLAAVAAGASHAAERRLGYEWDMKLADEVVLRHVPEGAVQSFTGPAGQSLFVDTSRCFHYGSRIQKPGTQRYVAVFQYLRPIAFRKYVKAPYRHLAHDGLSRAERLVLGAPAA